MIEKLFFAEDILAGIKIEVITSSKGIRNILINKSSLPENFSGITRLYPDDPYMLGAFDQLREYFNHQRKKFDLVLEITGTEFQKKVWNELLNINYGETISYKELAIRLGDLKSIRAAASANGANPLPIVIPCHRVIGADGTLIGYGGGLEIKEKLLQLEGSRTLELFN